MLETMSRDRISRPLWVFAAFRQQRLALDDEETFRRGIPFRGWILDRASLRFWETLSLGQPYLLRSFSEHFGAFRSISEREIGEPADSDD